MLTLSLSHFLSSSLAPSPPPAAPNPKPTPITQSLTEIKALLASRGLRPRHALGQNFLHDGNHLRAIVEAAGVGPGDRVLEVGPGTGTLTGALLDAGTRVVACELDAGLAGLVRERFGSREDFELIEGDCLDGKHGLNPEMMDRLRGEAGAFPPFKLVANLPYQAASPLLANLAGLPGRPMTAAVVMLQKEVADRLTAGPGSKAYGALGVLLQAGHAVDRVAVLPASCFWPQPKVQSAVARLVRLDEPLVDDLPAFGRFLHTLFAKRRKQLGAVLGRGFPFPEGVDPNGRAEDLPPEALAGLFKLRVVRKPDHV